MGTNYHIGEIEYYLPRNIISNKFLNQECGISSLFLEQKIGIKERRKADANQSTSDLGCKAAEALFIRKKVRRDDIDLLLVCTQNPDYRLPTTACIIQDKMGLKKSCVAFDINLGCSGFVYSVVIAGNFIKTGMIKHALLIMADQYSKIIDYKDKNTASLFGDASSAILLSPCEDGFGVIDANLGTDGSGAENLILYNSGIVRNDGKNQYLHMDGKEIFKFSITEIPNSINKLLFKNNLKIKDIKFFIFHQANKYILTELQKTLQISSDQMIIDMEFYGNTVSSTVPIAYKNLLNKKKLKKDDLLIFCGFGVGLSWGTILYKYS